MKTTIGNLLAVIFVAASLQTHAQGLVYDQQTTNPPSFTGDYFNLQADTPLMQSFIPSLSAIRFAQFQFWDMANNGTNGATVYVNLWTGSPNTSLATLLGSTTPVYMPNGFGASSAGVTTFYFSTLVALTAGNTYYLEPLVLSGDNPWAIKVAGDAYSNGQLYGGAGGFTAPFQPTIDLYFTEGIVAAPEPSIIALFGLSGVLVFCLKRCSKLPVLFLAGVLFTAIIPPVHSAPDSVVQATADEAGLTRVSEDALPRIGTFWVMTVSPNGRLYGPPYPFMPPNLSAMPTYYVKDNIFIVDDTDGQLMPPSAGRISSVQAAAAAQAQAASLASLIDLILNPNNGRSGGVHAMDAPAPPGGGGGGTNGGYQPGSNLRTYGSNDLWLSITSATNGIAQIVIHPPWNVNVSTDSWNVFYTTNVAAPFSNWWWILTTDLGQTNLAIANATDTNGFYALGNVNTNANSPIGDGDFPTICPNTTSNSITLVARDPNTLPLTYILLTHPTNGVLTGTAPTNLYYTPNPCVENAQDSFIYMASDGTNNSAPATVAITIGDDNLHANPVSGQTCRGMATSFMLDGGNCGGTARYEVLTPANGTVTNVSGSPTDPNYVYMPTGTNYTGNDSFGYIVYDNCGTATNTVTITVGDQYLSATSQTLITGTNQPLAVILSAMDYEYCNADTNYYTYTVTSGPTNGTITNIPPNFIYTPTNNYEGPDSFQFTVRDGVWSNANTITIAVTAGPILYHDCNPFSTAVLLGWTLDTNEQAMFPNPAAQFNDFIVYRSAVSGSNYTAIATNHYTSNTSWMTYLDTNAMVGQTNYYVVTFQAGDYPPGVVFESPRSNEIKASGQNLNPLITATNFWDVVTNLANPSSVTRLQAPFSDSGTNLYPGVYPLPQPLTFWPGGSTWSNHTTIFIPTNSVPLAQVTYSIAIDNNYKLYLNNSATPIDETDKHDGDANWAPFKSFPTNLLHYGTNDIGVWIEDGDPPNYFSMIVSTNTCGQ